MLPQISPEVIMTSKKVQTQLNQAKSTLVQSLHEQQLQDRKVKKMEEELKRAEFYRNMAEKEANRTSNAAAETEAFQQKLNNNRKQHQELVESRCMKAQQFRVNTKTRLSEQEENRINSNRRSWAQAQQQYMFNEMRRMNDYLDDLDSKRKRCEYQQQQVAEIKRSVSQSYENKQLRYITQKFSDASDAMSKSAFNMAQTDAARERMRVLDDQISKTESQRQSIIRNMSQRK